MNIKTLMGMSSYFLSTLPKGTVLLPVSSLFGYNGTSLHPQNDKTSVQ